MNATPWLQPAGSEREALIQRQLRRAQNSIDDCGRTKPRHSDVRRNMPSRDDWVRRKRWHRAWRDYGVKVLQDYRNGVSR